MHKEWNTNFGINDTKSVKHKKLLDNKKISNEALTHALNLNSEICVRYVAKKAKELMLNITIYALTLRRLCEDIQDSVVIEILKFITTESIYLTISKNNEDEEQYQHIPK